MEESKSKGRCLYSLPVNFKFMGNLHGIDGNYKIKLVSNNNILSQFPKNYIFQKVFHKKVFYFQDELLMIPEAKVHLEED